MEGKNGATVPPALLAELKVCQVSSQRGLPLLLLWRLSRRVCVAVFLAVTRGAFGAHSLLSGLVARLYATEIIANGMTDPVLNKTVQLLARAAVPCKYVRVVL